MIHPVHMLRHFWAKKVRQPALRRQWQARKAGFVHTTQDGLKFNLSPSEYIAKRR